MLNYLKNALNHTTTENGAVTLRSSGNYCLDLFFRAGGMRDADEAEIGRTVTRAYTENPADTMKILFYIRDIRGGMGERRFFRIAMQTLAKAAPDAVRRNLCLFAEYGRYDDLCALFGTPCEADALALIAQQFRRDIECLEKGETVSLLAKWLPSLNASSAETRRAANRIARALRMAHEEYRKTLSALRRRIDITENYLRTRDYSFDYAQQPSGAMFKYHKAFSRNDGVRYANYLRAVEEGKEAIHTAALFPYQIVRTAMQSADAETRRSMDVMWRNLPDLSAANGNALAVVDGSGSMYAGGKKAVRAIDAAISLGIYFAEHNRGAFANHFITFSQNPRLVEIKGADIHEKVRFCASFNEVANTDLEAVFRLILMTAVQHRLPQSEMPERLFIISDMEFDRCVTGGTNQTLFDAMQRMYRRRGYTLPQVVFWNVASRHENIPVSAAKTGAALVSGAAPSTFDLVMHGTLSPEQVMRNAIDNPRYAKVS